jgi:CHAT domain-containing protein
LVHINSQPTQGVLLVAADAAWVCSFLWVGGAPPIYFRAKGDLSGINGAARSETHVAVRTLPNSDTRAARNISQLEAAKAPSGLAVLSDRRRQFWQATTADNPALKLQSLLFPEEFRSSLKKVRSLTIIGVGATAAAPLANLEPFGDGTKVIDHFSVNVLRFAADLRQPRKEWRGRFSDAVIFVNPKGDDHYWKLPDIPETVPEGENAHKLFGGKVFSGNSATVGVFYRESLFADLIYFAGHAISDDKDPLRRSYVALADGGLTADMIKRSRLQAELIVLSACQTGLGDVRAAGVVSLARVFIDAGARNVLMSLWSVNDEATSYLMIKFSELLADHSPSEALRRAQIYTRSRYPAPVYWAGFSVFGNSFR